MWDQLLPIESLKILFSRLNSLYRPIINQSIFLKNVSPVLSWATPYTVIYMYIELDNFPTLYVVSCKSICFFNTVNAAGVSRGHQVKKKVAQKFHKFKNSEIWSLYLESPWEMHSNKYKHARYRFWNVWNCWHFVWMVKPMAACKSINQGIQWHHTRNVIRKKHAVILVDITGSQNIVWIMYHLLLLSMTFKPLINRM